MAEAPAAQVQYVKHARVATNAKAAPKVMKRKIVRKVACGPSQGNATRRVVKRSTTCAKPAQAAQMAMMAVPLAQAYSELPPLPPMPTPQGGGSEVTVIGGSGGTSSSDISAVRWARICW